MDFNALQDTLQGPRSTGASSTSIENKYVLLNEIGRGSYGVVWKARKRHGTQLFAVKQINIHRAGTKGLREVMGEVETMSLLSHPNIVRLEETVQDAGSLWIVMEFLPGGELQKVVTTREMQESVARRVVSQLLMAVEYIHDKGIVHRDLKLTNCLLTDAEEMVVKISDFGFAVLAGADQCLSTYCGTVAFMAPEILLEHNYGKPVDMWALGVMTYYMVTGTYPFTGTTTAALRRTICAGNVDLNVGRLKLFPLLRDFLSRLLVCDPHRRMTAKEALQHPWVKVGRENNAGTPVHYLATAALDARGSAVSGQEHHSLPAAAYLGAPAGHERRRRTARARWRGAVVAVMAAHRLLYLQRCRRLSRLGFGQLRLLRDYHYSVTGRYETGTATLDCSRAIAKNPQALTELLPMVQSCPTLTSLDLSHNGIDSLALVQSLVKVCGVHPGLQTVSLAHNPIPAVAGRGLLRLARNPATRVTSIDLSDTHIPEETIAQIKAALREKASGSPSSSSPALRAASSASALDVSSSAFTLPPTTPRLQSSSGGLPAASLARRLLPGGTTGKSLDDVSRHSSASAPPTAGVGSGSRAASTSTAGADRRRRAHHTSRLPPLPVAAVNRRVEK